MNLDNGIAVANAPFTTILPTTNSVTKYGIYKVILYAKTSTDSIKGWNVNVKDTTAQKSDTQSNKLKVETPCKSDDQESDGTDTFPFLCDANLAATQVIVQSVSASAELAEIVVVGFAWDAYPCGKGYFSDDGSHSNTGGQGCRECNNGTYQGEFSATNLPKECTACVNTAKRVYYTNTLEHKQATSCEVCAAPDVAKSDASGCEKCPAGEEYKAEGEPGKGCTYPTDLASKRTNPGSDVENKTPSSCTSVTCEACPPGTQNPAGSAKYCYQCTDGQIPNSDKDGCDPCDAGKYMHKNRTACVECENGWISAAGQSQCTDCAAGNITVDHVTCTMCAAGTVPNPTRDECRPCETGKYQDEPGKTTCKDCLAGHVNNTDLTTCHPCPKGQQPNVNNSECVDCKAGQYQETEVGDICKDCAVGHYSANPKTATCTLCETGRYQDAVGQTKCLDCVEGTFAAEEGWTVCSPCEEGHVTRTLGQTSCTPCQPGEKANEHKTDCVPCEKGDYQDGAGQGVCKQCPYNTYSKLAGAVECTTCETDRYAMPSSATCTPCPDGSPDQIRTEMADSDKDEKVIEKCLSDLGEGCFSREIKNQYGTFALPWLKVDESESFNCKYDDDVPAFKAKFTCTKTKGDKLTISEAYSCKNTENTEKIEALKDDRIPVKEKTERLEELTGNVKSNGLGDVEAVADVLATITEDKDNPSIDRTVTISILKTVSNLVVSDLKVSSSEEQAKSASSISNNMLKQIVKVAQTTSVKNTPVTSTNVAVIDVRQGDAAGDAPNKNSGVMSFTLPKDDQSNKDLNNMAVSLGSDDEKDDTILLIETKAGDESSAVDMAIVLITDSTLMPDTTISVTPASKDGADSETVQNILEDLQFDMEKEGGGQEAQKSYVNSFITEIKVENPPDDFKLNLFMKPNVDIGDNNNSLKTEGDGKRIQVSYICAEYDPENAKWTKSCNTIYDSAKPSLGVLCLCNHNTSFAVLMSAFEVDRGYAEVQSYLTYVLLGLSTIGIVLTLIFLVPAKALRSTRSAKINICFSMSLLLASLMFLVQDAFVNAQDTGLIKLKSTGCAVYAMIQHYLWLVVFVWMVVESFLMYLSLVQVFGSHISKYMLKFNIAAWGIPLPFPFIGYFVFTKQYTVGSFTFTKHDYLADTMCFIKPESIAFYTLFLTPIMLVIIINLIFFALVAKVIKNSKSSGNISDQEQVLRQLKAAVGVMVLLGTGWFVGIFMSVPAPQFQVGMQYLFIFLNSSQGFFVFLFYVVLNEQVKNHWLVKIGLQGEKRPTTSSSGAGKSSAAVTKATAISKSANHDNIYEDIDVTVNPANNEEHTYASAEFPAKSDNNANI